MSTSAPSVHNSTGLSAVLLGAVAGYRVFYQRSDETLAYLTFTNDDGWSSAGVVSHDTARSAFTVASGYTDTESITVVTPKDDRNIGVSALEDDSWHISERTPQYGCLALRYVLIRLAATFPRPLAPTRNSTNTTGASVTDETSSRDIRLDESRNVTWSLPAWDGTPGNLGVTFDSAGTRSIFYIGTDRMLHMITQTASGWRRASGQDTSAWPLADRPSAPFAITSDFGQNKIWIYYVSGGEMTQVHASGNDTWEPAIKLPQVPPPPEQASPSSQGLSTGAKAGIGVGAAVGGLAIIAAISYLFLVRRRRSARRKRDAEAEAAAHANAAAAAGAAATPSPDPARPGTDPDAEAKADEKPQELSGQDRSHELEDKEPSHELDNQVPTSELPGDWRYPESKKEDAAGN